MRDLLHARATRHLIPHTRDLHLDVLATIAAFHDRYLRRLFCEDTNISPEACFDGKIIVIDLPVQEFGLTGRVAAMAWKYCTQAAIMRRPSPPPGKNHRPVCIWMDEANQFLSGDRDAQFAAVCRSAGGCLTMLAQNREIMRRALGSDDTLDAMLGNLQSKWFCQNSGETNDYAARLLGERWKEIEHSGISYGGDSGGGHTETAEQRRFYVEPVTFATLKRGGPVNDRLVETIVYNGGAEYDHTDPATGQTERVPYARLTLRQEG